MKTLAWRMTAVVFHGVGDIRLDDISEPTIAATTDAVMRLTATATCGTDLHMVPHGARHPSRDEEGPAGRPRRHLVNDRLRVGAAEEAGARGIDPVASGRTGVAANLTQDKPMGSVIGAYERFDRREPGWLKVKVAPPARAAPPAPATPSATAHEAA